MSVTHLLLYVVYTYQKSFDFIDVFSCYKQKLKVGPFNLAHPVDRCMTVLSLCQRQ